MPKRTTKPTAKTSKPAKKKPTTTALAPVLGGPTSAAGKAITKMNAARHGLHAKDVIVPRLGETAQAFNKLREELYATYQPRDAYERHIVDEIVDTVFRAPRIRIYRQAVTAKAEVGYLAQVNNSIVFGNGAVPTQEEVTAITALPGAYGQARADKAQTHHLRTLERLEGLLIAHRSLVSGHVEVEDETVITKKGQNEPIQKATRRRRYREPM